MEVLQSYLESISNLVWGPGTLILLVGTGIFLTIRLGFLPWRNLFPSLKELFSKDARKKRGRWLGRYFSVFCTYDSIGVYNRHG